VVCAKDMDITSSQSLRLMDVIQVSGTTYSEYMKP